MAKQTFNLPKFLVDSLLALMSYAFVDIFYKTNPWLTASFLVLIGLYYLISIMKFFFLGRKYSMVAAYFLFYFGGSLVLIFLIWAGNMFLRIFNPFFTHLGFDFQIGYLFPGIFNFVCSVPALIAGLVLIISGILWEHKESYLESLKNSLLRGI